MTFRHLLWKDAKTIQPLLISILIGSALMNVLMLVLQPETSARHPYESLLAVWYTLPFLLAFGAPAMLIGTEQEAGTLMWLRSLPVRWQSVADSKLVAALLGLAIVWLFASIALLLSMMVIHGDVVPSVAARNAPGQLAILYTICGSVGVLLCGFCGAYLFRAPIAGLFANVFLMFSLAISISSIRWASVARTIGDRGPWSSVADWALLLGLLIVLWGMQRMLAWCRLATPDLDRFQRFENFGPVSRYRPPAIVSHHRPSAFRALLWQQFRQAVRPCLVVLCLTIIALVVGTADRWGWGIAQSRFAWFVSLWQLMLLFGPCWLGCLVFSGDNVRDRRRFFADHGISPRWVWWTRMFIPSIGILVIAVLLLAQFTQFASPEDSSFLLAVFVLLLFSSGLFTSQWTRRSVLPFLITPTLVSILGSIWMVYFFQHYGPYLWLIWTSIPVLLIGSRLLTNRWLRDETSWGYHTLAIFTLALAMSVPIVVTFGQRVATMPAAMPSWRAAILAEAPSLSQLKTRDADNRIMANAFESGQIVISNSVGNLSRTEQRERLSAELDSDKIAEQLTFSAGRAILQLSLNAAAQDLESAPDLEVAKLAAQVLLKWDNEIRRGILAGEWVGNEALLYLATGSELSEQAVVKALESLVSDPRIMAESQPALKTLIDAIPDHELRRQSRRAALISAWRDYDARPFTRQTPQGVIVYHKSFGPLGAIPSPQIAWFPFEQLRSDRYVDRLVRVLLEQLEHGLPANEQAADFRRRGALYAEALGPNSAGLELELNFGQNWTAEYEQRIDQLRERIAKE